MIETNQVKWAMELLEDNMEGMDNEERGNFLNDVCMHGCLSGIVSGAIYTADLHELFIKNMNDIMEVIEEIDYHNDTNLLDGQDASSIPSRAVMIVIEYTASIMVEEYEEA